MRSSNVSVLGVFAIASLAACSVTTTGNSITLKTQTEFVDSSQAPKTATADWNGEKITVNKEGQSAVKGTGGIVVTVDPNATKVSAKAIFVAYADDDAHKSDADASIADALGTFTLTESAGAITITCGHGGSHGTSSADKSGCKLITLTIPPGSATTPHDLNLGDGNGGISFVGAPYASHLAATENGTGDIDVKVNPTKDARVVVTGDFDVTLSLPADFQSNLITLNIDDPAVATAAERAPYLDTTAFPDLENGKSYPTAGVTSADAAQEINAWMKSTVGKLTLKKL
jgi:hypothetical protein